MQHDHDRGLTLDVPVLRRRRLLGLAGGTTVATLSEIGVAPGPRTAQQALVRGDIRRSFGTAKGVARGVPLTLDLRIAGAGAGLAVYVWHADQHGAYSLYAPGLTSENYLRGIQPTDAGGRVEFSTIFPGAYDERGPHVHFEIYPGVAQATAATGLLLSGTVTLSRTYDVPAPAVRAELTCEDGLRATATIGV